MKRRSSGEVTAQKAAGRWEAHAIHREYVLEGVPNSVFRTVGYDGSARYSANEVCSVRRRTKVVPRLLRPWVFYAQGLFYFGY